MKRNRIVINFDRLKTSAGPTGSPGTNGSRRGIGRPLLIIAVVLLLLLGGLAGGAYFWWRHYQDSPAYTLAVLADAAQRNDTATVDGILDTDKVTDDFIAQIRQRTTGSAAAAAISSVWPVQTESALQTLSPKLKQTVHDELVKELQRLTEPARGKPFILLALVITRFADISEANDVAQVKVNVKDEHLQLTMQPSTKPGASHWRITAVQDDKLAKLVADGMTRNIPGAQLPEEIHKQLDKFKK